MEHLWLAPAHIRQGLGRELFQAAVAVARTRGIAEFHIKSDLNAEPFYLKMGAVRVGREVYELRGERREVPRLVYRLPGG